MSGSELSKSVDEEDVGPLGHGVGDPLGAQCLSELQQPPVGVLCLTSLVVGGTSYIGPRTR